MPDAVFAHPRLAPLYDLFDSDRRDLDGYEALIDELAARSVLDVGCGTGSLACRLAARGLEVTGVDPALASLEVARGKPGAEKVRWLHGDATGLPPMSVDLAIMTGNVAQVFVDDADWESTLAGIREALRPGGWLVFETRDPSKRAWEKWTPERTRRRLDVPAEGTIEQWYEVLSEAGELVTFRSMFHFLRDDTTVESRSTLRFRSRQAIEASLVKCGFELAEVRDAPDRPGLEFVFLARRVD
jgi:SAM-dependent methyltransferase